MWMRRGSGWGKKGAEVPIWFRNDISHSAFACCFSRAESRKNRAEKKGTKITSTESNFNHDCFPNESRAKRVKFIFSTPESRFSIRRLLEDEGRQKKGKSSCKPTWPVAQSWVIDVHKFNLTDFPPLLVLLFERVSLASFSFLFASHSDIDKLQQIEFSPSTGKFLARRGLNDIITQRPAPDIYLRWSW